jgi:hypothetical protein
MMVTAYCSKYKLGKEGSENRPRRRKNALPSADSTGKMEDIFFE